MFKGGLIEEGRSYLSEDRRANHRIDLDVVSIDLMLLDHWSIGMYHFRMCRRAAYDDRALLWGWLLSSS